MNRWERTRRIGVALLGATALALPLSVGAQVLQRPFPPNAFRGELVFSQPPVVQLNGQTERLAPGARVRDAGNLLVLPMQLQGRAHTVNYTRDLSGQVLDVWLLSPDEAAKQGMPEKPVSTTLNLGPLGSYTFSNVPKPDNTPYDKLPRFQNKY